MQDVPGVSKRSSKGVPSVSEWTSKRGSKTRSIDATVAFCLSPARYEVRFYQVRLN